MAMSTPVNKLQNNPNFGNVAAAKLEEDMLVKGVIDEMESEVTQAPRAMKSEKPYDVHTTNVATFRHNSSELPQTLPYHPQYKPLNMDQQSDSMWNADDAQFAATIAVIAFAVLYPLDVSQVYSRFDFLSRLEPYDVYIRALLFAFVLYVVMRKGLIYIPFHKK